MKMNDKSKINMILVFVIAVLAVTFGLSFKSGGRANDKRKVVKTSLVNPKYKDTITRLELSRGEDFLFLQKEQGIWFCETGVANEGDFYHILAEQKKVEDFLNQLTKVLNLSKISYKNNDISSFGFNSDDQFTVLYDVPEGGFYEIKFGNHDFSLSNRYVMGAKNIDIYEVDSSFERYLYTAMNQWYDPYIISRNINGEYKLSDVQRVVKRTTSKDGSKTQTITPSNSDFADYASTLLELRHGGAASLPEQISELSTYEPEFQIGETPAPRIGDPTRQVPSLEITLEMGDTSEFNLRFFPNEITGKITALCKYDFAPNRNRQITYTVEISEWTYEKF